MHDIEMSCQRGLVQRSGVRVKSHRVVTIRVFCSIQQESYHFDTAVLTRKRECYVPCFGCRGA